MDRRSRRICSFSSQSVEYFCFSEAVRNFLLKEKSHRQSRDLLELLIVSEDIQFINKCFAELQSETVQQSNLVHSFYWLDNIGVSQSGDPCLFSHCTLSLARRNFNNVYALELANIEPSLGFIAIKHGRDRNMKE